MGESAVDIRVREALPADAEALGAVHYRAWMETYTGLIDPVYLQSMSAEKSAAMFRKQSCREILAAEADGRVVGFCGYGVARDADAPAGFGEIRGIYVLRAYQRCGIGKSLLASAAEALRAQGFRKAYLWVLRENDRAIRFYERNGFQFDGAEKTDIRAVPVVEKRYSRVL